MLEKKQLIELMKAAAQVSAGGNYSYEGQTLNSEALNKVLRDQLNEIAGTYELYRENKNLVFSLIEETVNEILPQKVADSYASFAETRTFAQGDKPIFVRKGLGKQRAKQFITKVGLAGVYEVFKLGETSYEVKTSAIGGAAQIGFEEFLDGRANFAEVTQIVYEGMDELIYKEVAAALMGSINQLPAANKVTYNGFDEAAMDRLITVASAYGTPTIYCTREFAVKMVPKDTWRVSESMKDTLWNTGYLANYKGCRVIILPQGFTDDTNSHKVLDPGYIWVIPSNMGEKPVKIAFEGTMHMRERENEDWSRDMQVYQKVGVGVVMTNNICSYVDETLKGQLTF